MGSHPDEPRYQIDLAASLTALGNLLYAADRSQDAAPLLREAMQLRERLAERFPDDAAHQNSLAWLLANCADPSLRNPERAVEVATRAVELDPARAASWNTLGTAHLRSGQYASAIEGLYKSIALGSGGDGNDWFFLAMAHWQAGDKDEARRCCERAAQWMNQRRRDDAEMSLLRSEVRHLLGENGPDADQDESTDDREQRE